MALHTGLQVSDLYSTHIPGRQCTSSPRVASETSSCNACFHPSRQECGGALCAAVPTHGNAGRHHLWTKGETSTLMTSLM